MCTRSDVKLGNPVHPQGQPLLFKFATEGFPIKNMFHLYINFPIHPYDLKEIFCIVYPVLILRVCGSAGPVVPGKELSWGENSNSPVFVSIQFRWNLVHRICEQSLPVGDLPEKNGTNGALTASKHYTIIWKSTCDDRPFLEYIASITTYYHNILWYNILYFEITHMIFRIIDV